MPRQNTSPTDYPQAVLQQIEQLAQNIVIARRRRGETQAQWAKKLGVSQPTMARIERGDPAVAMASYVMCIWIINPASRLAELISPLSDHAALEREVSKATRKRKGRVAGSTIAARSARASSPTPGKKGAPKVNESPPNRPADVAREPTAPVADDPKALAQANRLSDWSRMGDPLAVVRKMREGATQKSNPTASGLASLLLKTQTKSQ